MSEGSEIGESDLTIPDSRTAPWVDAERAAPRGGSAASETVTKPRASSAAPARPQTESQFRTTERDKILHALTSCNWNRGAGGEARGAAEEDVLSEVEGVRDFGLSQAPYFSRISAANRVTIAGAPSFTRRIIPGTSGR